VGAGLARKKIRRKMSQHIIDEEHVKWVFGWDHPLCSFFLQMHDKTLDIPDGNPVVWLGATRKSVMYEVEELVLAAKLLGLHIPYEMEIVLYADKDEGR
jgi:hypothetical protein